MGPQPALDTPLPHPPQAFGRIKKWLEHARTSPSLSVLAGGKCDDSVGYFVEPCIVESKDPQEPIMKEVTGGAAGTQGRQPRTQLSACTGLLHAGFFLGHRPISQMRKVRPQKEGTHTQWEHRQALSSGLLTPNPGPFLGTADLGRSHRTPLPTTAAFTDP